MAIIVRELNQRTGGLLTGTTFSMPIHLSNFVTPYGTIPNVNTINKFSSATATLRFVFHANGGASTASGHVDASFNLSYDLTKWSYTIGNSDPTGSTDINYASVGISYLNRGLLTSNFDLTTSNSSEDFVPTITFDSSVTNLPYTTYVTGNISYFLV